MTPNASWGQCKALAEKNHAWEDVADDVSGAIEKAVQPLIKRAVDDIYAGLLDATQDYLKDNLAFNIASRISASEREVSYCRQEAQAFRDQRDELLEALEACRAQFDFYASEHRKAEKHEKAATNERFAFLCSQAINKARGQS